MAGRKTLIYNPEQIRGVRAAAQAAADVLTKLCDAVRPGMSTKDVDDLAELFIREAGGTSGSYRYFGFPGQICISLNDEVVHGIGTPDRIIQPEDLVKLDVVVKLNGYYGDNARTICAGGCPDPLQQKLMEATRESLRAGIAAALPGNTINDIGGAVENTVKSYGFSVVEDFVGHGCGISMHEEPSVPNYRMRGRSPVLKPGMIICIEPMVNAGTWQVNVDRRDKWTVRTADHALSAHFENQILITEKEPEILTVWPKNV